MTVDEALQYIHSVSWKGSIPGLSRVRELLHRMNDPQNKLRFIHIAGTNGKGSTAAMLASIFQQAGYVTGLYTSPFITRFHERMQVNGEPISDDDLTAITQYVQSFAAACSDTPTEFELVSAIAMEFFARRQCDIVILEAGMGGEFDATNIINTPDCAVICNIGLDHTQFLGNTLEAIAETKCGIFKEGGSCVTYPASAGVETVYQRITDERHLNRKPADLSQLHPISHDLSGQYFDFGPYKRLHLPLLGAHQLKNAAVVLTVVEQMRQKGWQLSENDVRQGLSSVSWPGRFEVLCREPLVIVDGGHNPQCMDALMQNINDYLPHRPLTILTGVMADKDYASMYREVTRNACQIITVTPPTPRSLPAPKLAEFLANLTGKPTHAADSVADGVRQAMQLAGKNGTVLAFGSLYMVGDIRKTVFEQQ